LRVATRRLRAVTRRTDAFAGVSVELKWLAGALGAVRDLDVVLDGLRIEVETLDDDRSAGNRLVAIVERERRDADAALQQALGSDRFRVLLTELEPAIDALTVVDDAEAREVADRRLRKLANEHTRLGGEPTDAELHALRLRAKRARYAADRLPAEERMAAYLDALKRVQDVLGEHQDAVVAEVHLRRIATGSTAVAAGRLIERARARKGERRSMYAEAVDAALDAGDRALIRSR